jgi:hypothetical protein
MRFEDLDVPGICLKGILRLQQELDKEEFTLSEAIEAYKIYPTAEEDIERAYIALVEAGKLPDAGFAEQIVRWTLQRVASVLSDPLPLDIDTAFFAIHNQWERLAAEKRMSNTIYTEKIWAVKCMDAYWRWKTIRNKYNVEGTFERLDLVDEMSSCLYELEDNAMTRILEWIIDAVKASGVQ